MKRVLVLDGDPFAWKAAVREEKNITWADGVVTAFTNVDKAVESACRQIDTLAQDQSAEVVFCWSDPSGYFREALGDYKKQRKQTVRPLALHDIKEGLAARYESYMKPTLEGDDVIGILMTETRFKRGYEKICVSIDKDLKTIPGLNLNPDKDTEPKLITEHEADLFFYAQVIAGDPTDGFKGAPSFGMDTAIEDAQG